MPNRCGVVNCKGNYDEFNKVRVFKLPNDEIEKRKWVDVLPPRANFEINPSRFFICERHWPENVEMIHLPGGHTKPACPPSIFNVPTSCLPTPKSKPRPPKIEDRQLTFFYKKDKIVSFSDFNPDKELKKKYNDVIISRSSKKCVCLFMTEDYSECTASIIVHDEATLCSPLTLTAYKRGISVLLGTIINSNNGLATISHFFDAVHSVVLRENHTNNIIQKAITCLENIQFENEKNVTIDKAKKLKFIIRQLELLRHKTYIVSDYCFALECYPKVNYEMIKDYLVLPCARKLQTVISTTGVDKVLTKTFQKINSKQKNCLLIIDEVKIRPTIAYSGGVLSGMSHNNPDCKASSMLCVMMKCLHGGPSVMVSVTPVNKLTAAYQFNVVKNAAVLVEKCGGVVLGSITDNHKINQQYCKLFVRTSDSQAIHPLNEQRCWFLLYDTVHLLKCIRNNWISEKCKKLSFDNQRVGTFSDVVDLHRAEEKNVLKCTPLTNASVHPSRLQLQNVKHVLKVFNDKVVAALQTRGATGTSTFIRQVLDWWNTVNVAQKGMECRLRDPCRSVQDGHSTSTSLEDFLDLFKSAQSGHGEKRVQCLTHDTRRALVQTMEGLIFLRDHLLSNGFQYVLLREIQSDRIEGEFAVYRQSTGANSFMSAGDVVCAYRKRLARFAASYLSSIESDASVNAHACQGLIGIEDASSIKTCLTNVTLSDEEENAAAYVAGWLEKKCEAEMSYSDDEPLVSSQISQFILEVSRGFLKVPHESTFQLVRVGLCFVKQTKHKACCRRRLMTILSMMDDFYNLQLSSQRMFMRLANVLLHGLQNLDRDHDKNTVLYQTSVKKARLAD